MARRCLLVILFLCCLILASSTSLNFYMNAVKAIANRKVRPRSRHVDFFRQPMSNMRMLEALHKREETEDKLMYSRLFPLLY
ncbi:hypothetical protein L596_020511 [Steinernema carpocapsae]|uniref:Uncharacterized protein n=1 Tax=Steinernema carpocapsae TaxID=34508 RepID=A0A4U5MTU6_STECR|nr:hypothetical protein L596_020511 [Steinernema carpocapsae]